MERAGTWEKETEISLHEGKRGELVKSLNSTQQFIKKQLDNLQMNHHV